MINNYRRKVELKDDMYIRTSYGKIDKILELNDSYVKGVSQKDDFYVYDIDNIVKASYNIIDILEVGDYANGYYISKIWEKDEITHYVNETPIKRKEREIVIQAPSYGGIEILKNEDIKLVITHEQMEQMAYKVDE